MFYMSTMDPTCMCKMLYDDCKAHNEREKRGFVQNCFLVTVISEST